MIFLDLISINYSFFFSLILRKLLFLTWGVATEMEMIHVFNWVRSTLTLNYEAKEISKLLFCVLLIAFILLLLLEMDFLL